MKNYFKFEWEFLNSCPICNHDIAIPNGKISYMSQDFWYVICPNCNTKYMNPRPTKSSYDDFYKNYFWEEVFSNNRFRIEGQIWNYEMKDLEKLYQWNNDEKDRNPEEGKKIMNDKLERLRVENIDNILSQSLDFSKKNRILEVGAGIGVTLNYLNKKYNCEVDAIEPSKEACKIMEQGGSIKVVANYAEEIEKISDILPKYDCIIFAHSLENTLNPKKNILDSIKSLTNEGIIYIQCSNLFTFDQMNPYHPFIFSFKSLDVLANTNELKIKKYGKTTDRMLNIVIRK